MNITATCVPCLLTRVLYEIKEADDKKKATIIHECTKLLSQTFDPNDNSAKIATKVHALAYQLLGDTDPYKKAKEESNEVALKLFPKAEQLVFNSENQLRTAILVSIAANVLDFGNINSYKNAGELIKQFDTLIAEGLGVDDTPKLIETLRKPEIQNILYFSDNAGEIIFDILVFRELKKFGKNITLVVKGKPILTDATIEDVKKYKIDKEVDQVLTTGQFAVGVEFESVPEELKYKLTTTDLIIAKGMANYESFSDTEYKPIAYLLRTKCEPIAKSLNVKQNMNVIRFI